MINKLVLVLIILFITGCEKIRREHGYAIITIGNCEYIDGWSPKHKADCPNPIHLKKCNCGETL